MGEVRDKVMTPEARGILSRLRTIEDDLGDCIETKTKDLGSEGEAMKTRNQRAIDLLRQAMTSVQVTRETLTKY